MSMSTYVVGFIAPDGKWKKMKAVWDSCTAAGIDVPLDVIEFFNDEPPNPLGSEVEVPAEEWNDDYRKGFVLAVKDIPKNVTHIGFYNSW